MNFNLEHIGLPARDPVALKDWYVAALGAKIAFAKEDAPPMFLISFGRGALIEICAGDFGMEQTANKRLYGWRHIALQVDSLENAKSEVEKHGVVFSEPVLPAGGGGRVLFFQDPEGNLIHLVERPKGATAFQ